MAASLRSLVKRHGLKGGALQRLRAALDLAAVDEARVAQQGAELAELRASSEPADSVLALKAELTHLREELDRRFGALEEIRGSIAGPDRRGESPPALDPVTMIALQAWVRGLKPVTGDRPLISVVTPTRHRPKYLARALRSVQAQGYEDWEVLVVDDGTSPTAVTVLAELDDPRFRLIERRSAAGADHARNDALEDARGSLVVYLDDDCTMGPDWLVTVAWAFGRDPELEVAYGVRVVELDGKVQTLFPPFDRAGLARSNLADTNVMAHRAGLPRARWDASVSAGADWLLFAELTREREPLALPVLAAVYDHGAPDRISDRLDAQKAYREVARRIRAMQPLRVLGVNSMFPLLSETYVHDELQALEQRGVELAWCRMIPNVPAPMPVTQPLFTDLDEAVASFVPDVLMLHWATFAHTERERLRQLGVPYGVRVHSFDFSAELVADLLAEPLCIGVWRYPSEAYVAPGTRTLPPIFSSITSMPPPAEHRDVVLSVSAGLPKKDWPTLVAGFGELDGVDARILAAVTVGHEDEPARVLELALQARVPPLVQINVTRDAVHELLSRTALFVYTLLPQVRFGMPMSIAEALCAGCSVLVPDRPEARAYAGPTARTYRTAEDITRHAREVLAGGEAVAAEQAANRAWGLAQFCDPAVGDRFLQELRDGLAAHAA